MSDNERLPFDAGMCLGQYAQTVGFVEAMQGDPRIEAACAEAERKCAELFNGFYEAPDRTLHLAMLGYLAMDIAANVAYTLDRATLRMELE